MTFSPSHIDQLGPWSPGSKSELLRKVVSKGKLDAVIVRTKTIQKVFPPTELKLAAYHYVLNRIEEEVA